VEGGGARGQHRVGESEGGRGRGGEVRVVGGRVWEKDEREWRWGKGESW